MVVLFPEFKLDAYGGPVIRLLELLYSQAMYCRNQTLPAVLPSDGSARTLQWIAKNQTAKQVTTRLSPEELLMHDTMLTGSFFQHLATTLSASVEHPRTDSVAGSAESKVCSVSVGNSFSPDDRSLVCNCRLRSIPSCSYGDWSVLSSYDPEPMLILLQNPQLFLL